MKKVLLALGCTFLMFSQASIAVTTINGSIPGANGNTGSGSTGVDVGIGGNVVINGQNTNSQQSAASGGQANKTIHESICFIPFMKNYAVFFK